MPRRSRRVPSDLGPNALAAVRAGIGGVDHDLTNSNPTTVDIDLPADLLDELAAPGALRYRPEPRGPAQGRAAAAATYRSQDLDIDPERVVLTASTSEAYGFLFRLLCDPGDAVLVPTPSYPLFDQLATLDGIEATPYALDPETGWRLHPEKLADSTDRVRAVVVVHPNNPTGSYVHPGDTSALVDLCRDRGWALIADEVFLPYPLEGGAGAGRSFAATDNCLCFTLGGLSKSIGQPQLKLAWIVVGGPPAEVEHTLEGLDYVADAYLSVSTPVALAAPRLIRRGAAIRAAISERCRSNLKTLRDLAAAHPAVTIGNVGGGWSAVVQVPAVLPDEELCIQLLESESVAVHPGLYFGFPRDGYLVLSLLPPPQVMREGARRLLRFIGRLSG